MSRYSLLKKKFELLKEQVSQFESSITVLKKAIETKSYHSNPSRYKAIFEQASSISELKDVIAWDLLRLSLVKRGLTEEQRSRLHRQVINLENRFRQEDINIFIPTLEKLHNDSFKTSALNYLRNKIETFSSKKNQDFILRRIDILPRQNIHLDGRLSIEIKSLRPEKITVTHRVRAKDETPFNTYNFHFPLKESGHYLSLGFERKSKKFIDMSSKHKKECFELLRQSSVLETLKQQLNLVNSAPFKNKLNGLPTLNKKN